MTELARCHRRGSDGCGCPGAATAWRSGGDAWRSRRRKGDGRAHGRPLATSSTPLVRGVAIAPGGGRAFGSPGGAPGTSRGAVGSRATPCPCGTESKSKAAGPSNRLQSCRGRSTLGPKVCDHCAAICEHNAIQLPLVELLVTRRGVRQQHTTTARRCPGPGRLQGREPPARVRPATRASGGGTCGTSGAGISLRDIRRTGPRAACFTRRTPPRKARQRRPPTERGLPPAGAPRPWRRCASLSARCRRLPPPASRGSGSSAGSAVHSGE